MPDFATFGSLLQSLHQDLVRLYYILLPVFFSLALVFGWARAPLGGPEFMDTLKRTLVATLLLVALPEITQAIVYVADGIAERIETASGLDAALAMAKERADQVGIGKGFFLLQFADLILPVLTFLSYIVLYVARYGTIAMYHFFWALYVVLAPLLLLFNLFPATDQIVKNLFRGMIEIACWKIVWAILSAMLASVAFADVYKIEGNHVTVIFLNFVIAVALWKTPKIVSSLSNGGVQGMRDEIGSAATGALLMAATKGRAGVVKGHSGIQVLGQKIEANRLEKKRLRRLHRM